MKYRVFITQTASNDLNSAARYIAHTLQNPTAASHFLDAFDSLVRDLQETAHVYPLVRDEFARAAGYRGAEVGNYMVFFTIDQTSDIVYIERVAYKKRNWSDLIN